MSSRQSEGIVQVFSNDPREINDALATITNRLDHLKGLRGRTLTYDRIRAENPTTANDVLTRGSLSVVNQIVFVAQPCGLYVAHPGISLQEVSSGMRKRYNFGGNQITSARLIFSGWGTETGNKRMIVGDGTDTIAEVLWSGTGENIYAGEFTAVTLAEDIPLRLHTALSTNTESLVLNWVVLELSA